MNCGRVFNVSPECLIHWFVDSIHSSMDLCIRSLSIFRVSISRKIKSDLIYANRNRQFRQKVPVNEEVNQCDNLIAKFVDTFRNVDSFACVLNFFFFFFCTHFDVFSYYSNWFIDFLTFERFVCTLLFTLALCKCSF